MAARVFCSAACINPTRQSLSEAVCYPHALVDRQLVRGRQRYAHQTSALEHPVRPLKVAWQVLGQGQNSIDLAIQNLVSSLDGDGLTLGNLEQIGVRQVGKDEALSGEDVRNRAVPGRKCLADGNDGCADIAAD